MRDEHGTIHSETDEARAGSTPHIVRRVLVIGTLAAIILLSIVWITGAVSQGDIEEEVNASQVIRDTQETDTDRSDIDGIVSGEADEFAPETPADVAEQSDLDPERTVQN